MTESTIHQELTFFWSHSLHQYALNALKSFRFSHQGILSYLPNVHHHIFTLYMITLITCKEKKIWLDLQRRAVGSLPTFTPPSVSISDINFASFRCRQIVNLSCFYQLNKIKKGGIYLIAKTGYFLLKDLPFIPSWLWKQNEERWVILDTKII